MRVNHLIKGDIRFQIKYGFYFVYTVFTIFYICLLFAFPKGVRSRAAAIMIYSDPAAMGLFFMGAIILLEKSQFVLDSIAVSPVKASEYIISKTVSLGIIGTIVGVILAACSGAGNIPEVMLGTFLGSVIFSLLGLIVATRIGSLNQFMMATIPFELLCSLPPVLYLFGYRKSFMLLHPGCVVISLISGEGRAAFSWLFVLLIWIVLIYYITSHCVKKMFGSVGGVKL